MQDTIQFQGDESVTVPLDNNDERTTIQEFLRLIWLYQKQLTFSQRAATGLALALHDLPPAVSGYIDSVKLDQVAEALKVAGEYGAVIAGGLTKIIDSNAGKYALIDALSMREILKGYADDARAPDPYAGITL
jgi:hypothetical protein